MKKIIFALLVSTFASAAHAETYGVNGCYTASRGTSIVILCLDHVGEESIDGSGSYLGVFLPYQATKIAQCWNTVNVVRSATDYAFQKRTEIARFQFDNTKFVSGKVLIRENGVLIENDLNRITSESNTERFLSMMTKEACK